MRLRPVASKYKTRNFKATAASDEWKNVVSKRRTIFPVSNLFVLWVILNWLFGLGVSLESMRISITFVLTTPKLRVFPCSFQVKNLSPDSDLANNFTAFSNIDFNLKAK